MTSTRRPSFDLLSAVMAFGVVAAIAALAYPAFRDNPTSAPGLVLILTVGAIALIGLFGFRRAAAARRCSSRPGTRASNAGRARRSPSPSATASS